MDEGFIATTFETTTTAITFNDVVISNPTTSALNSVYSIDFVPEADIPENGILIIEVPRTLEMTPDNVRSSGSCVGTVECIEVVAADPNDPNSMGYIKIRVKDRIIADRPFTFDLGGVRNPRNTAPSTNFIINSFDESAGVSAQIGKGTGANIEMSELAPIEKFSGTTDGTRNGSINKYTFSITSQIALEDGDKLTFDLPDQIKPPESSLLLDCQEV